MELTNSWTDNEIEGNGAKMIGEVLKRNTSITSLIMDGEKRKGFNE